MRRMLVGAVVGALCLVAIDPASGAFPGSNGRIAYLANDGLHTILPSGAGDKLLPHAISAPAWSPTGTRIAGIRSVGEAGQSEIYSMRADGADLQRLTHSPRNDSDPAYAPGGHRIVFGRDAPVGPTVMTMHTDGSGLRRLGQGVPAAWSPNGKWITYVVGSTARHRPSVWAMHANGTSKHRLLFLGSNGGVFLDYSPDGKRILFTRCAIHCNQFLARSNGNNVEPAPCQNVSAYSPDGRWYLGGIVRARGGFDLARVSASTCSRQRITSKHASEAAWQSLPSP